MKWVSFLVSMGDLGKVIGIYENYFDGHKPARSCVQVSALPRGAVCEIECIAFK
eukprot:EW708150.1.p2 GENE.EW708150.1~~EW708150.1.p2  ORF type:complete len:54 (+),score=13.30 EW708150.1:110-271(+)